MHARLAPPPAPPKDPKAGLRKIEGLDGGSGASGVSGTGAAQSPAGDRQQAYSNSCGANTLMAMEAAVDPQSAQRFQGMNDQERANMEYSVMRGAGFADGQIYNRGGFEEVSRGSEAPAGQEGIGLNYWGMRTEVQDRFGSVQSNTGVPPQDLANETVEALEAGSPVALGLPGHWVSATDVRGESGSQEVLINDSWTGESHWVSQESLGDGSWVESFGDDRFLSSQGEVRSIVYPDPPAQLNPDSQSRSRQEDVYAQTSS